MHKKRKEISGIEYTANAYINADCSVTVKITTPHSKHPVFEKNYYHGAEVALSLAYRDYDKQRAQIFANKAKL